MKGITVILPVENMGTIITYVGMDTHKKEHTIALHYPDQEEIVRLAVRNTSSEIGKNTQNKGFY
jgi:hypothetical protein